MRHMVKIASSVAVPLLLFGCGRNEPEPVSMMHQVLGALQIPGKTDRDAALASACRDSAAAGDLESVVLGLPKIADKKLHDEVVRDCVQKFVDAGRDGDAKRISELPRG